MDYEAIDRNMSSYALTCQKGSTRFFLSTSNTATDIWDRAAIFRWQDEAQKCADVQNAQVAWRGFDWTVISVPAALVASR